MASNKLVRFGPIGLGTLTASLINAPALTGGTGIAGSNTATYVVMKHLRIINRTAAPATFSLFIGGASTSTGGTEFMGSATTVGANSYIDWYGLARLETADFLNGFASAAATLTIQGEGEIGIV